MEQIQRFKDSLVTGSWKDNPESLVRDSEGDYVLFSDYESLRKVLNDYKTLIQLDKDCSNLMDRVFTYIDGKDYTYLGIALTRRGYCHLMRNSEGDIEFYCCVATLEQHGFELKEEKVCPTLDFE